MNSKIELFHFTQFSIYLSCVASSFNSSSIKEVALDPGDGLEAFDTTGLGETIELDDDNAADLAEEIEVQMVEG